MYEYETVKTAKTSETGSPAARIPYGRSDFGETAGLNSSFGISERAQGSDLAGLKQSIVQRMEAKRSVPLNSGNSATVQMESAKYLPTIDKDYTRHHIIPRTLMHGFIENLIEESIKSKPAHDMLADLLQRMLQQYDQVWSNEATTKKYNKFLHFSDVIKNILSTANNEKQFFDECSKAKKLITDFFQWMPSNLVEGPLVENRKYNPKGETLDTEAFILRETLLNSNYTPDQIKELNSLIGEYTKTKNPDILSAIKDRQEIMLNFGGTIVKPPINMWDNAFVDPETRRIVDEKESKSKPGGGTQQSTTDTNPEDVLSFDDFPFDGLSFS